MQKESAIELDHAIGYSGTIPGLLYLHPTVNECIIAAGATVIISDLNDSHNQQFLKAHDDQITCLAISHNGKLLASGQMGENSDIIVWDYETKKKKFVLSEHDYSVKCLSFSHDDRLLFSCGNQTDGNIFIWDMSTGCIVATTSFISLFPTGIQCACFGGFTKDIKLRPTSNYQFATAGAKKIVLWSLDPYSGSLKYDLINTGSLVRDFTCLTFSIPNEQYLYAGTTSSDVLAFQMKNKISVFNQKVSSKGVSSIQYCNGGKLLVGAADGLLFQYAIQEAVCKQVLKAEFLGSVNGLSVSKDELHAIVGTEKGFIYRLKLSDFSKMLLKETHTSSVLSVVYPKGTSDKFITSSLDGSLRLWDVNDYIAITRCAVFSQGYPTCSDLTDEIIVSGWSDCKIRAFRVDNGEPIWAIDNAHKGGVSCIQLSSNLKFIISGGNEGDVRIWEIKSREMISHLKEHTSKVTGIKILSDNVHAISCSRDRSLLLWDLKAEKRLISIQQRMGGINSMALNNSEDSLLTVGQERRVCYWTFKSPTPIKTLLPSNNPNDEEEMLCIALSHSNKYFAAGGCKGFIRVWEYDTCKLICESKGHSFDINAISFSHDDKQVVTVGQDGIIFIWNLFLG